MNQVAERKRLPDRADDEQWERGQTQPTELLQPTNITLTMVPSADGGGANPRPTKDVCAKHQEGVSLELDEYRQRVRDQCHRHNLGSRSHR